MPDIDLISIFYALSGGALSLLAALLLVGFEHTNSIANRWLGVFYAILSFNFIQLFLEEFSIGSNVLLHLLELPRWAMLPCFYMAIRNYTIPDAMQRHWLLHFMPFILFLMFSGMYLMPNLFNDQHHLPQLSPWLRFLVQYFFFGQMIYYWIACLLLFQKHQKNIKNVASYTHKIDLTWLRYLLIALLFMICIRFLGLSKYAVTQYYPILYFVGTMLLGYATLTQKSIYTTEVYQPKLQDNLTSKKTVDERLSPDQLEELKSFVLRKVTDDKLYLDPSLTLSILSQKIGVSTHELSYILNNGIGKNFYQFINDLRTEEAKGLLMTEEAKRLDMFGVAIKAGFNSKTTFYTYFKKATDLTPKAYIKEHQKG